MFVFFIVVICVLFGVRYFLDPEFYRIRGGFVIFYGDDKDYGRDFIRFTI